MSKNYDNLFAQSKKARLLESISSLLEWDQETYMPKAGATLRASQLELMASLSHKERTSATYEKQLAKLIDLQTGQIKDLELSLEQRAALREWRRDFLIATSLPNTFVKSFAKLSAQSMTKWAQAREKNDFASFAPYLEKIVEFCQKKADYLGYKHTPYDALLDIYEPQATSKDISTLFSKVKKGIFHLLKKIQNTPQIDDSFLHGTFSQQKQLDFGRTVLQAMGYDLNQGSLDLSTHPFSMSLHPSDSRITTRLSSSSVMDALSAIMHEGGHSLYEMGLPTQHYGSPLCEAVSLSIHESQSRLWETHVGQSRPFWEYFFPLLIKNFPTLKHISLDQFYKALNKVAPSLNRVESDEVTYTLHVILRFELEKQLIEGTLQVRDLPEAWNAHMQASLGICPESDKEGCLQDIHWSIGAFGYFPTYGLGNLYAAQFFSAFEKNFPHWKEDVAKGRLLFLREWLKENIHCHGRIYPASSLVKTVTGNALFEKPYLTYLDRKYSKIYS